MLVALTGASGLIGSHTIMALRRMGHQVRAQVRPTTRRDHIAPYVDQWCVGDQANPQVQAALVRGVDAVIHNAVDWEALARAPLPHFEKNVLGALALLEAARLSGVPQFIFVSSVAAYHHILPGGIITENHPTWPGSIYGASKAAVEAHLKAYHTTYGMNTSAWRPASVYGMDPNLGRCQWVELVKAARDGQTIDTDQGGKITHVLDAAEALALAVGDAGVAGEFYNIVDGYLYWQEVAQIAKDLCGSAAIIENRKGSGPRNQFDGTKAIAFFERHANNVALRRGVEGVRSYVRQLLQRLSTAPDNWQPSAGSL